MAKKLILIVAVLLICGLVAAAGWYLASPLFINDVVNEDFPAIPSAKELAEMSPEEMEKMQTELLAAAAEMPDKMMDDPMPESVDSGPVVVTMGQFEDADSFHQGSGGATIYQQPDGSHVLRFENFEVTNGPDLHVLLVENPAPAGRDEIMAGYVDLGSLKGNVGNQNYTIPAGADASKYRSVVIYCMPFHVVFSTATLS